MDTHRWAFKCIALLTAIFLLYAISPANIALSDDRPRVDKSPLSRLIDQPTITSIYQDRSQVLWVGTQHGLYRFNGADRRIFSSNLSGADFIPVSDIRGIAEDSDGNILIATFGAGLLKWDASSSSFRPSLLSEISENTFVRLLHVSNSGIIWVGTSSGLAWISSDTDNKNDWLHHTMIREQVSEPVDFEGDQYGNTLIATKSSLWLASEENRSLEEIDLVNKTLPVGASLTSITLSGEGHLYVATDKGHILIFETGSDLGKLAYDRLIRVPGSITETLFEKSILWAGTSDGLFYISPEMNSFEALTTDGTSLSNDHITQLYSRNESVWVGTYQGLNNITFPDFSSFNSQNSGIFNDVLAFEQDQENRLWVGTYSGAYFFDLTRDLQDQHATNYLLDGNPNSKVMTIASKKNEVWFGLRQGGVHIFKKENKSATKLILSDDSPAITKIIHDRSGDTWIGTYEHGLYRISGSSIESFLDRRIFPERTVTLMVELESGDIIVGTETNIYKYSAASNRFSLLKIRFDDVGLKPVILSLQQSENGDLWIGTKDHGLFRLSQNIEFDTSLLLDKIAGDAGFDTASIYGLEIDSQENIWCSTQSGIVKLDENGNFLARYDKSDGLQGNDFNFGASFADSNGLFYFGGINGFNKFDPLSIIGERQSSPMLLTKIVYSDYRSLHSLDTPSFNHLQLTHKNYFVTFEFSVLDFIDPENNQFRYKLENFDPEWIENGKRNTATYTNLPAGEYTFSVQGANSAGVWNREGISMQVTVLPAPWFTWWAYVFYLFIFGIIVWLGKGKYDSYTIGRLARDMAIEMRENEERAYDDIQEHQDLHDDLVTVAHQHNVQTLALINNFIVQQQQYLSEPLSLESSEKCSRIISSLSALENCLLYQGDGLVADLRKLTDSIFSDLLEQSPVDPGSIITINDVTSDMVPAELASLLAVFIHEAVENAFVHAFDESSPANYVQVSLAVTPRGNNDFQDTYSLTISDSGIGIPIHLRPETSDTQGLGMMQAIATRLNGSLQISVNEGTQVSLSIPITMQL